MKENIQWIIGVFQMVAVPIIVFICQHKLMKKINEANGKVEDRKTEALLSLNLTYVTAELACATATALKRGQANGEIEKAMKTYEKAKSRYIQFLHGQAHNHLHETEK